MIKAIDANIGLVEVLSILWAMGCLALLLAIRARQPRYLLGFFAIIIDGARRASAPSSSDRQLNRIRWTMNAFESFLVGLVISFCAGVLSAILVTTVVVSLNRPARRKVRQFVRLLGLAKTAKLGVFGSQVISVSEGTAQAIDAPANPTFTPSANITLNFTVIRRSSNPVSLKTRPIVTVEPEARQSGDQFVIPA
jgi:hypothetical protein